MSSPEDASKSYVYHHMRTLFTELGPGSSEFDPDFLRRASIIQFLKFREAGVRTRTSRVVAAIAQIDVSRSIEEHPEETAERWRNFDD